MYSLTHSVSFILALLDAGCVTCTQIRSLILNFSHTHKRYQALILYVPPLPRHPRFSFSSLYIECFTYYTLTHPHICVHPLLSHPSRTAPTHTHSLMRPSIFFCTYINRWLLDISSYTQPHTVLTLYLARTHKASHRLHAIPGDSTHQNHY